MSPVCYEQMKTRPMSSFHYTVVLNAMYNTVQAKKKKKKKNRPNLGPYVQTY